MIAQLEFPLIAQHFPTGTVKLQTRPKRAEQVEEASARPDPLLLAGALTAENIGFLSFAIIVALHRHKAPMALAALARVVGHSYWAVRSQIVNTHYFTFTKPNPLVAATLTDDAITKLARIEKRLRP